MIWPDEVPTVKLANPLADPPARRAASKLHANVVETETLCASAIARAKRMVKR